ncbi:MAG: sigma-70 family RNA polymerase sigma factor [Victivallaceae bacterium]|jgi:RNA polymerase sigma-70 factor (ECF subfamily)
MTDGSEEEFEIRQMLAADNPAAMERIYNFAGRELYYYLAGLTGSVHDAEELLHDLFIKIVDKRLKLSEIKCLKAYLYRTAANLAYDRIRRNRRENRGLADYAVIQAAEEQQVSEEDISELNRALGGLPPEQRQTIILKIFMKKTFDEVAAALNIPVNTAVSRHRYALKKLRTFMEGEK